VERPSDGSTGHSVWGDRFQLLLLILIVYVFLVSIGMMGGAFKLFGKGVAERLVTSTSNPLVGLFIGILATTLVQSSSTTTSLTVGLVAAGGLSIESAIPLVMGANIGTSVTNTLVSMGHVTRPAEFRRAMAGATVHDFFNLIAVCLFFPLELSTGFLRTISEAAADLFIGAGGLTFASPIKILVKPAVTASIHTLGESPVLVLIVSFVVMYASLKGLVSLARGLVVRRAERALHKYLFGAPLASMAFGVALTVLVQSSSISTSLVIPLVGAGLLTVEQVFPYMLGANIGTTVTAMLAALSTLNTAAITIAFVHLFFNICGILVVYPFRLIRLIPIRMSHGLAHVASRSRTLAVGYIVGVFYLIPAAIIYFWSAR